MTENDVINKLCHWLEQDGWQIETRALNRDRGDDIRARKNGTTLLVEAKGAKGNPELRDVVRDVFDAGQIKDHLGKAIVKVFELKNRDDEAIVAIAHPNTERIRRIVDPLVHHLNRAGILLVFVSESGSVEWLGGFPQTAAA